MQCTCIYLILPKCRLTEAIFRHLVLLSHLESFDAEQAMGHWNWPMTHWPIWCVTHDPSDMTHDPSHLMLETCRQTQLRSQSYAYMWTISAWAQHTSQTRSILYYALWVVSFLCHSTPVVKPSTACNTLVEHSAFTECWNIIIHKLIGVLLRVLGGHSQAVGRQKSYTLKGVGSFLTP